VRTETAEGAEQVIGVWNLLDDSRPLRALVRTTLPRIRTCRKLSILRWVSALCVVVVVVVGGGGGGGVVVLRKRERDSVRVYLYL
jgi:hypothetical protein